LPWVRTTRWPWRISWTTPAAVSIALANCSSAVPACSARIRALPPMATSTSFDTAWVPFGECTFPEGNIHLGYEGSLRKRRAGDWSGRQPSVIWTANARPPWGMPSCWDLHAERSLWPCRWSLRGTRSRTWNDSPTTGTATSCWRGPAGDPMAGFPHQAVLGRIHMALTGYLAPRGAALLVSPGAIQVGDDTQLEPDLLVIPSQFRSGRFVAGDPGLVAGGGSIGPSSRIYDRDFKTAAYLEAGVREVWRVDLRERIVYVSCPGRPLHEPHADRLVWHPPGAPRAAHHRPRHRVRPLT